MKLLTHNFITSKCIKGVNVGFPLGIVVWEAGADFGPGFTALRAETLALVCNQRQWCYDLFPGVFKARDVKEVKVDFNGEFISRVIQKLNWDVLYGAASSLECASDLPKTLAPNYENDEEFLKKAHHVLLEVEVISGDLVCPETGRIFPVSDGIPNMLVNEDEV